MKALGRKQNIAPKRELRKKPCIAFIPCIPEFTAEGVSGFFNKGVKSCVINPMNGMWGTIGVCKAVIGRELAPFTGVDCTAGLDCAVAQVGVEGIGMLDHTSITGATEKFPISGVSVVWGKDGKGGKVVEGMVVCFILVVVIGSWSMRFCMTIILLCFICVFTWEGASKTLIGIDLIVSGPFIRPPSSSVGGIVGGWTTVIKDVGRRGRLLIGDVGLWLFTITSLSGSRFKGLITAGSGCCVVVV